MNVRPKEDTMAEITMRNKSFLTLADYSPAEIEFLLDLAVYLKEKKATRKESPVLAGLNVALIFEKGSTRTRCSFEVACYDQGAKVVYMGPGSGSHFGSKETIKDSARVMGRMFDAIVYRGHGQEVVETLSAGSGKPVFNALTDEFHPTQGLADLMTLKEKNPGKSWSELKIVYVGDARNNVSNSLLIACCKVGVQVGVLAPKKLQPAAWLVKKCTVEFGGQLIIGDVCNKTAILAGANAVYTDVWISMGEPKEIYQERLELLKDYQVNHDLMELTKTQKDAEGASFFHCLPANQDMGATSSGRKILKEFDVVYGDLFAGKHGGNCPPSTLTEKGMEVTSDVFESSRSVVFEQAENRLHTIKACLVSHLALEGSLKELKREMATKAKDYTTDEKIAPSSPASEFLSVSLA